MRVWKVEIQGEEDFCPDDHPEWVQVGKEREKRDGDSSVEEDAFKELEASMGLKESENRRELK